MLKNLFLLCGWQVLTLFPVPAAQIRRNAAENRRLFEDGRLAEPIGYIENQPQLGGLKFGAKYDFSYSGCSVIAVYNTLRSMGEQASGETLCEIAEGLQRRGVALRGKFGVAPLSLKRFLERCGQEKGFTVRSTMSAREDVLDALGEESDAVLAVVWNGRKLREQVHAVHIEKRKGEYIIHNACYLIGDGKEAGKYAEKGAYDRLSEAIGQVSAKGSHAALVMGIRRR